MKPFIKKIRTKNNFYIYDINTNHFLRVDKIVYKIIDDIYELSTEEILDKWNNKFSKLDIIHAVENVNNKIKEEGLFSYFRPKQFKHIFSIDEIKDTLKNSLMNLCLEVTQQCNMRCQYCAYSGKFYTKRKHNDTRMSYDIAKKAIDFFLEHSKENENKFITFYGGEPLLSFSLIKKCVGYINEENPNGKIYYGITTNGTLLNDDIIRFFKQNNFFITISLDGPREIHNQYRKFYSGQGTYDIIIKNIKKISQMCRNNSASKIKFNIAIVPSYNLSEQMGYFDSLCKENDYLLNPFFVNMKESNLFENEKDFSKLDFRYKINKIKNIFRNNLLENKGSNSPFLKALFSDRFRKIYNRGIFRKLEEFHPANGICIPGWEKLFVDSNGIYFICEKMTDFSSIGDVYNGFELEKIFQIMKEYIDICNIDCRNCWAIRLCSACFVATKRNKKLDREEKRHYCKNLKKNLEKDLIFYLGVLEKNPFAFDYMRKELRYTYMENRLNYMRNKAIHAN